MLIAWLRFILVIQAVPHTLSLTSSYHSAFSIPSLPGSAGRATSCRSTGSSMAPKASRNRLEGAQPTVMGSPAASRSCSVAHSDADREGRTRAGTYCALRWHGADLLPPVSLAAPVPSAMRAMADQAAAAADASPTLAPSPGSPRCGDTDGLTPHPTSTREDSGGRDSCGLLFTMDGDTKPLASPQPGGMLLADLPRAPQPRLSPAKSRTAPSSPSVSPSESRVALLRLRDARLEDTKRRLSEAVQEPLSRLSRLMAEESSPAPRAKAGSGAQEVGGNPGQAGGHRAGGRRAWDWSPWEPTLNCRYEICSYGDVIQVVEVAQRDAAPCLPPPEEPPPARPGGTVPGRALASIALLAYGYFILPLPPYAAGLCLGLICGLVLGFLAVLLLVPKPPLAARRPRGHLRPELLLGEPWETHHLQVGDGWYGMGCWVAAGGVPGARGAALRGCRAHGGCRLPSRMAQREAAGSLSSHPGLDEPATCL